MGLKSYRDLEVWQRGIDLVAAIYRLTEAFPKEERYGLTSQLRRAAVSVPANIAEGYARPHRGDYLHHLSVARGSLAELETHLVISVRLEIVQRESIAEVWNLSQEVGKMLTKLVRSLERDKETLNPKPQTPNPKPQTRDPRPRQQGE